MNIRGISSSRSRFPHPRVLFVCTGNSCRSQMAEAWARRMVGTLCEPYSAGLVVNGLDPHAVTVMAEAGVNISGYHSKSIGVYVDFDFDCVITLSEQARARLPRLGYSQPTLHAGFDAPREKVTRSTGEVDGLSDYRRVRDEIRAFVASLPVLLPERGQGAKSSQIHFDTNRRICDSLVCR
jgi:arsenate reductase (thioredoxin)